MEHIRIDAVEEDVSAATVKRRLTSALGTEDVAINYYELAPGDTFAFGYHMHESQEEIFLVLAGTVTFETESGNVEVSAEEAIRFGPGEFQQGTNQGDERVRAFALGAPKGAMGSEILRECTECGGRTQHRIEVNEDWSTKKTICKTCGAVTGRYGDAESA